MALVSCNGCGNEVNARAETCPRCGTRVVRSPLGPGVVLFIVVMLFVVAIALWLR